MAKGVPGTAPSAESLDARWVSWGAGDTSSEVTEGVTNESKLEERDRLLAAAEENPVKSCGSLAAESKRLSLSVWAPGPTVRQIRLLMEGQAYAGRRA